MFQEKKAAFMDADKITRKVRGNGGKAWATNVPCCTLVTGEPLAKSRYVPNDMILNVLLNKTEYQQFPIPKEFVLGGPDYAPRPADFQWGRRYTKFGYFLENPATPGYGNIYRRSPTWEDRPAGADENAWCLKWVKDCLPALDLVEWWENGGCDGHTEFYRVGHAVVPNKLWNAGDSHYGSEAENYPYAVDSALRPYPSDEESIRRSVGMLSEFVQPVNIDRAK